MSLAVLGALAVIMTLFLRAISDHAAGSAYDQLMSAAALSIADAVRAEDGAVTVDLPYSSLSILGMARRDRVFYKVLDGGGRPVTGYDDLPGEATAVGRMAFSDGRYRGVPVRLVSLSRLIAGAGENMAATIVVAQTTEERGALSRQIFLYSLAPLVLTFLVGAVLSLFGIRKVLSPLTRLERRIKGRAPNDFSPLTEPVPREIRPLLEAINDLMARLASSLDTARIFLADTAHEIRTPLASLRAQAELAADEDDPARLAHIVGRIHHNAVHVSDLTTQLLNHAAILHRSEVRNFAPVDIAAALAQVSRRIAVVAEDVEIVITVAPADATDAAVTINGDAIILREAFANLIGNAVKYAPGRIDIIVHAATAGHGVIVEVADRGPGIAAEEREEVMKRFVRGSSSAGTAGSGLGLAIITTAAEAHQARFAFADRDGGGLVARLTFPPPSPASEANTGGTPRRPWWRRLPWRPLCGLALLLTMIAGQVTPTLADSVPAPDGRRRLNLHTSTDRPFIQSLVDDFEARNPDVAVDITVMMTAGLYATSQSITAEVAGDLIVSSAADLQIKLANDGFARTHVSASTARLPAWANWRDEVFSFTQEPAIIVYNTKLLPAALVPKTRADLIRLLKSQRELLRNRLVTYDVSAAGFGYLFATEDSQISGQYWQLATMFGEVGARYVDTSGEMLDLIVNGKALIGYNMLGTYARQRQKAGDPIGIVLPEDYTLLAPRTALIPSAAANPDLAGRFIDYLLSPEGQAIVERQTEIPLEERRFEGDLLMPSAQEQLPGTSFYRINLGPGLLVFRDSQKRAHFLDQWRQVSQPN